jgi:phage terminase large subunit-like protein
VIQLPEGASPIEVFASRLAEERAAVLAGLSPAMMLKIMRWWPLWARAGQVPPEGEWRTWLILAGRGFGKTRAGAEWVCTQAALHPGTSIALVGATTADARAVMVEGDSGILACSHDPSIPKWEPSLGRLTWPTGARAFLYSAAEPEGLRGPQHQFAWCDELAKWRFAEAAWSNIALGLRSGQAPRALVTTTPRPLPLLKRIMQDAGTRTTRGRTADNLVLPESFVNAVTEAYGGTRLGRQELDGEMIEDVAGSLWPRTLIERCRAPIDFARDARNFTRVVIGVDPPATAAGDACGIVAAALDAEGCGHVLGDHSVRGERPEGWARAVVAAAEEHGADRVIAEANNGGQMVESVLRAVKSSLPIRLVHASRGKAARAEPVAALFEKKRAWFGGVFPELEDELAGLTAGGGYEGPGRSPDRADAMVWAMTELMLGKGAREPRIRSV